MKNLNNYIEHTLLRPEAVSADYERHFAEAMEHKLYAVCIPPMHVDMAKRFLKASSVKVVTVVGFPFGYNTSSEKTYATKLAVEHGADEIDMVLNISALKSGNIKLVIDDIRSVVHASFERVVKVIFETSLLTNAEKILSCELALQAGAHFVKTSTGFSTGGATEQDVRLLAKQVAGRLGVKASGGIRDYSTAVTMIAAGATRLGTSQSLAILTGSHAYENEDSKY